MYVPVYVVSQTVDPQLTSGPIMGFNNINGKTEGWWGPHCRITGTDPYDSTYCGENRGEWIENNHEALLCRCYSTAIWIWLPNSEQLSL